MTQHIFRRLTTDALAYIEAARTSIMRGADKYNDNAPTDLDMARQNTNHAEERIKKLAAACMPTGAAHPSLHGDIRRMVELIRQDRAESIKFAVCTAGDITRILNVIDDKKAKNIAKHLLIQLSQRCREHAKMPLNGETISPLYERINEQLDPKVHEP